MSPRPIKLRKISNPPIISGFKPYGKKKTEEKTENIFLHYEEYEAFRLCDYEMLNHHKASVIMNVSRPTLTRIYSRARQKIAEAMVKGSQIIIEGGKIYFDSEWLSCNMCGCYFNIPDKQETIQECPLCKSNNLSNIGQSTDDPEESLAKYDDICICMLCGYEQAHNFGRRCNDEICPKCNNSMIRKGPPHSRIRKKF